MRGIERSRNREVLFDQLGCPCLALLHQGIIYNKISIKDNLCLIPRQVTEMMLFSKEPESQTAAEGEDVIFECEAGGFPAPKVSRLLSLSDWLQTQIDLKIKLDHIIDPGQHYP